MVAAIPMILSSVYVIRYLVIPDIPKYHLNIKLKLQQCNSYVVPGRHVTPSTSWTVDS